MVRTKDETALAVVTALCPRATATSLNLPANLPLDRWQAIAEAVTRIGSSVSWWLGDLWAIDEYEYGERYRLAEDLPYSAHTCENHAVVSRAFKEKPPGAGRF
jgi:hypothetical protein